MSNITIINRKYWYLVPKENYKVQEWIEDGTLMTDEDYHESEENYDVYNTPFVPFDPETDIWLESYEDVENWVSELE